MKIEIELVNEKKIKGYKIYFGGNTVILMTDKQEENAMTYDLSEVKSIYPIKEV